MYVLLDMEWVDNPAGKLYPTQIAAMRVDQSWGLVQMFHTRIQPPDESFYIWDHVGYTGGYANEFLSAPPAGEVFKMLQRWLEPEDVLCWWKGNGIELFREFAPGIQQPHRELYPYLMEYLRYCPTLRGSAYRIVDKMGLKACGICNHSKSDVKTMRAALEAVRFPQALLVCECAEELALEEDACFHAPFVRELKSKIVHKYGCVLIPEGVELLDQPSLARLEKKDLKPCSCCRAEYMQARRDKNKKTIDKSEYSFVYTSGSNLFHRRNCMLILNARDILGSVYYKSCISLGRMPCQTCKPTRADEVKICGVPSSSVSKKKARVPISVSPKPLPKKNPEPPKKPEPRLAYACQRGLTEQERRAMKRLVQAQSEREKAQKNGNLTQQQKDDMMVLTQPRFGFWAAAGYSSFHLRHCSKLGTLSDLRGFSLYEEAIRAGYQPCRQCKPSAKHDLVLSMPIYSRERIWETEEVLEQRCAEDGFPFQKETDTVLLETSKGIWRIHTKERPYKLEHINKIRTPHNRQDFHQQPKIFLSLSDVYTYIKKHDGNTPESEMKE